VSATGGIVRPPRRPVGWSAPGPRPSPSPPRHLDPRPGEDLCYLAGDWRILQRLGGHRWSLDDLVTAWVAADEMLGRPPARIVDLGCGIGTVLLLLAWRFPDVEAVGIERQATSVALARRSLAWNGVEARCEVRHADFRRAAARAGLAPLPLVTGTPPYLPRATATASPEPQRAQCRLELAGGVEDYVQAAATLLGDGGRFVMCAAARQDARVAAAASAAGLASLRRLVVVPRAGKAPLFAVHVLGRAALAGNPRLDPPLVVRDASGTRTPAFASLRGDFGMPP
jgi:tRNA1(Val) A37 N6-methylase TrmN6